MLSRRAVSETFRSHSSKMRWMCPPHTIRRHGLLRDHGRASLLTTQHGCHILDIGRLRQIIRRTAFDGSNRGRDIAITGQHQGSRIGALLGQGFDNRETLPSGNRDSATTPSGGLRLMRSRASETESTTSISNPRDSSPRTRGKQPGDRYRQQAHCGEPPQTNRCWNRHRWRDQFQNAMTSRLHVDVWTYETDYTGSSQVYGSWPGLDVEPVQEKATQGTKFSQMGRFSCVSALCCWASARPGALIGPDSSAGCVNRH